MNDVLLLTDTHFGCHNFSKGMFKSQMNYFENVLFPYLIDNNIKDVIHLGDFVHNRNFVDLYILNILKNKFFKWFEDNEINFYSIVGNHDTVYKNTNEYNFQAGSMMGYKFIHPILNPVILRIGNYKFGLIPWAGSNNSDLPKPVDVDILAGHFEVTGALMQGNLYSKVGMKFEEFKEFKIVMSGHYHATSRKGNFLYLGSPYQTNWGDFCNKKGFWILKDGLELEYIENITSPKFVKIIYNKDNSNPPELSCVGLSDVPQVITLSEAKSICEKNHVKFIVKKNSDQHTLSVFFEQITENSYDRIDIFDESGFIEDIDDAQLEKDIQEELELSDIILNFLKTTTFQEDIKPEIISSMMERLLVRSKEYTS